MLIFAYEVEKQSQSVCGHHSLTDMSKYFVCPTILLHAPQYSKVYCCHLTTLATFEGIDHLLAEGERLKRFIN